MCSVSNGSWEFTFATMDGNSRIPILVSLEIANSFAGTNVIQVILVIRVITLVLKYTDRNPLFLLLLFIQQTWCVISHLKPHITTEHCKECLSKSEHRRLSSITPNDGRSGFLRIWRGGWQLGGVFCTNSGSSDSTLV